MYDKHVITDKGRPPLAAAAGAVRARSAARQYRRTLPQQRFAQLPPLPPLLPLLLAIANAIAISGRQAAAAEGEVGAAATCQGLAASCASSSSAGAASCCEGLSCHPGVLKCYRSPRAFKEPCAPGHGCGSGLYCIPPADGGASTCQIVAGLNETCAAPHSPQPMPCITGLSCEPGIWKCYNVPRRNGQPCSKDNDCGDGLRCGQRTHVCKPIDVPPGQQTTRGLMQTCTADKDCSANLRCDPQLKRCTMSSVEEFKNATKKGTVNGIDVCLVFREKHLASLSTDLNMAFTFGFAPSITFGMATGSVEFGVAYGPGGQYGCYMSVCGGATMGLGISAAGAVGNYFDWSSIPGTSLLLGGGYGNNIENPKASWKLPAFVQIGVSATAVANTDLQLTGYVVSLSISLDVLQYLNFPLWPPVFLSGTVCNTSILEVPRHYFSEDYPSNAVFADYTIVSCTGTSRGAGTDGDVYVWLSGSLGTTVRPFSLFSTKYMFDYVGANHERGHCYEYNFNDIDVGRLDSAKVRLVRKTPWDSWELASLQVTKIVNGESSPAVKYCLNDWLDGSSDVVLTAADNECSSAENDVTYTVGVCTGDALGAGTDGDVSIKLCGTLTCTALQMLDNDGVNDHERGQCGNYTIVYKEIGVVENVTMYLQNAIMSDSWLLDSVQVDRKGQESKKFCYKDWLDDSGRSHASATLTDKNYIKCLIERQTAYTVRACTGDSAGAGTDGDVSVVICGELGCTPSLSFDHSSVVGRVINLNERGDCYDYKFELGVNVGSPESVSVSMVRHVPSDNWELKSLELTTGLIINGGTQLDARVRYCFDGWFDGQETIRLTSFNKKKCSQDTSSSLQLDPQRALWFRILPRVQLPSPAKPRCLAGRYYRTGQPAGVHVNGVNDFSCFGLSTKVNGSEFDVFGFADTGISSLRCGSALPPCPEGHCCGSTGTCGTSEEHCGAGCRPLYGACFDPAYYPPAAAGSSAGGRNGTSGGDMPPPRCGSGRRCRMGCCSSKHGNQCGVGLDLCGDGCDPKYGVCSKISLPGQIEGEYTNYFVIMNVDGVCLRYNNTQEVLEWSNISCKEPGSRWQVVVREVNQDGTKWVQLVHAVTSRCLGVVSQSDIRTTVMVDCQDAEDQEYQFRLDWFKPTILKRSVPTLRAATAAVDGYTGEADDEPTGPTTTTTTTSTTNSGSGYSSGSTGHEEL